MDVYKFLKKSIFIDFFITLTFSNSAKKPSTNEIWHNTIVFIRDKCNNPYNRNNETEVSE